MSLIGRIFATSRTPPEVKNSRRRERLRRDLLDAVHLYDKWSFADRPSEHEDRMENIYRLIREYERVGGDSLDLLAGSEGWLCEKAMPDTFERRQDGYNNRWTTYRRETA